MTEENQTKNEQKNTIATIGMIFSIVGLILLITIFGAWIWIFLLVIWLILWIIWLFYKPKKRARIAISIPLIVFIILISVACYIWKSIKTPTNEFINRSQTNLEQLNEETFDGEKFWNIAEIEINNIMNNKSENDWKSLYESSTWSNTIEKWGYLFFSLLRQALENSLKQYNEEVLENNNTLEENVNEDNIEIVSETDETTQEYGDENKTNEQLNESEQNDIEEILNVLD